MKRIVLVDNDLATRKRIAELLGGQGFDVAAIDTPTKALFYACADAPDLLIVDQDTDGMTGVELVTRIRHKLSNALAAVILAADPSPELVRAAHDLGIRHVLRKPESGEGPRETTDCPGEFESRLLAAVRRELYWSEAAETIGRIDTLRSDFLIDLSHQLRTPLTAMRLAMDGLFAQLRDTMNQSQRNLARIGRRNIDRVVSLVENQLDLLQLMAGERRIGRRLVNVNELLSDLVGRAGGPGFETGRDEFTPARTSHGDGDPEPLYVFTAPDVLAAVVDCLLGAFSPNVSRSVTVDFHDPSGVCRIDVSVDYFSDLDAPPVPVADALAGPGPLQALDFEYRAYDTLVGLAGGSFEMEKDDNHKRVRIYLPRYPEYDREKDFLEPVNRARGNDENDSVVFVKVELVAGGDRDFLASEDPRVRDVLSRCVSVTGEGDMILRSRQSGSIYLALSNRTADEMDHIVSFLGDGCGRDANDPRERPFVWRPQTVAPDVRDVDHLMEELERVR